jgi:hypothetical protein
MEPNAILSIKPIPDDALRPESFSLTVLPYPGGVNSREGRKFRNADELLQFLDQFRLNLRDVWAEYAASRVPFGVKTTFSDWRRVDEWADTNLPRH